MNRRFICQANELEGVYANSSSLTFLLNIHTVQPLLYRCSARRDLYDLQMSPPLTCSCTFASIVECQQMFWSGRMSRRSGEKEIGEGKLMRTRR